MPSIISVRLRRVDEWFAEMLVTTRRMRVLLLIAPVLTKEMMAASTISLAMMSLMLTLAKDDSTEMRGPREALMKHLEEVASKDCWRCCGRVRRSMLISTRQAQVEPVIAVEFEHLHGGAANGGSSNEMQSLPFKVVMPRILPRMEQDRHGTSLGIDAREIWAFAEIAIDAGEREIFLVILATMFSRADVFNVKRGQRRVVLIKPTVFAAMSCSFADKLPHCFRH